MAKNKKIEVTGVEISLYTEKSADYISLTDIARYRDAERSDYILQNWMRNRSTIEFMGLWEQFNPNYAIGGAKSSELPARRQAGLL